MTSTNRELISQVKNQFKSVNADSKLTNKFIYSIINKHAKWLVKRESDKLNIMGFNSLFQTYKCVEVIEAPAIDDCCGIKSKCLVMRTKDKLPELFEDSSGVILKSIFTIDGSQEFMPIKVSDYTRKLQDYNSKYDKELYAFYNNGYLYFPKSKIKMVMVKGFFKEDIKKFNKCENYEETCSTRMQEESRIPPYLEAELMDFVLKDIMNFNRRVQQDADINKNENRLN